MLTIDPNGTLTTRERMASAIKENRAKRAASPKQEPNGKAEWLASIGGTARSDSAWDYVSRTCASVTWNCHGKSETRGFYLDTPKQGTVKVRATRTLGHVNYDNIDDIAADAMVYAVELAQQGIYPSFEGCVANADRGWNNGTQYPVRILYRYDAKSETYVRCPNHGKGYGVNAVRNANATAAKRGENPPFVEFKIAVAHWGDAPPEQVAKADRLIQTDDEQRSMLAYAANIIGTRYGEEGLVTVRMVVGGGTLADAARVLCSIREGSTFAANKMRTTRIWAEFIDVASNIGEMARGLQNDAE